MNLLELLDFSRKNYPGRLSIFPLDGLLMEVARSNRKRPAYLKIAALDDVVMNLKGSEKLRDTYMVVRVPREVVDRASSPIVAPGEK